MSSKKEVAVKEEFTPALASMFDQSLVSSGDSMDKVDFRIPKLTLIQGMTKASYNTEKAAVGSYINSIEKNDLGDSMDLFVMSDTKLWELKYKVTEGKKVTEEYLGTIEYTNDNQDLRNNPRIPEELEQRAQEKGVSVDMLSQINMINRFYVLSVAEVMAGGAFPYIVDFKRASYQAGVQLKNSFFKMKKVQNLPSYARVFTLGSEFIQDEFDYYIKTVSGGRMITQDEIGAVESWIKELSANKAAYKEDDSDEGESVVKDVEVEAKVTTGAKPKF